jgi:dTDP-4-dehydrorhamnose reductase
MDGGILIVGARGMLGRALAETLSGRAALTLWDIEELDITNARRVRRDIGILAPREVINCAAWTDVDGCEKNPEQAMVINGVAPGHLAAACAAVNARLTHISSDYVFDGRIDRDYREDDAVSPLSAYGRSKLAGEEAVRAAGGRALILRSQWLYGQGGKNFVDTIARMAKEKDRLTVVSDQIGRPTWSRELAAGIAALLDTPAVGTWHLAAGGEPCSWYEFAREIVAALGIGTPVDPVSTAAYPRPAKRPARSALDCSRIAREWGIKLTDWRAAVRRYLGADLS